MEVRYERESGGLTTLKVSVDPEQVEQVYQKAVRDLRRHVNVPGFRPGRVPPKMVESIVGRDKIVDYARDLLQEEIYPKALAEVPHLVTLGEPEVELDGLKLGESAEIRAKVVTATVALGDYRGVAVDRWRADVSDEEADAALEREWLRGAEYTEADHQDVRVGDHVSFTLRIIHDGTLIEEFPEDEPLRIEIGHNNLTPNIDDHLIGLQVDQDAVFEVTYPEDFNHEELAGATCEFAVLIVSIEQRESLETWAERAAGFADRAAAHDAVKQAVGVQRADRFRLQAREAAVRKVVEAATVDVPRAEIDAAVMEEIEELEEDLRGRGFPEDQLDALMDRETDRIRDRVAYEQRRDVVLRALGQMEEIPIERDDIAREVAMMATMNRVEPRLMLRRLEEEGMMGTVARNARIRLTAEWIYSQAEVSEIDAPPEVLAAERGEHAHQHDHDHDHEADAGHSDIDGGEVVTGVVGDEEPEGAEPENEPCP